MTGKSLVFYFFFLFFIINFYLKIIIFFLCHYLRVIEGQLLLVLLDRGMNPSKMFQKFFSLTFSKDFLFSGLSTRVRSNRILLPVFFYVVNLFEKSSGHFSDWKFPPWDFNRETPPGINKKKNDFLHNIFSSYLLINHKKKMSDFIRFEKCFSKSRKKKIFTTWQVPFETLGVERLKLKIKEKLIWNDSPISPCCFHWKSWIDQKKFFHWRHRQIINSKSRGLSKVRWICTGELIISKNHFSLGR